MRAPFVWVTKRVCGDFCLVWKLVLIGGIVCPHIIGWQSLFIGNLLHLPLPPQGANSSMFLFTPIRVGLSRKSTGFSEGVHLADLFLTLRFGACMHAGVSDGIGVSNSVRYCDFFRIGQICMVDANRHRSLVQSRQCMEVYQKGWMGSMYFGPFSRRYMPAVKLVVSTSVV